MNCVICGKYYTPATNCLPNVCSQRCLKRIEITTVEIPREEKIKMRNQSIEYLENEIEKLNGKIRDLKETIDFLKKESEE